jgi:cysteine desulfurase
VDAVQAPGHVDPDRLSQLIKTVDFLSLSAHKFHGPVGIGVLYYRNPDDTTTIQPLFSGGEQQQGRRAGTEAVGAATACSRALAAALRAGAAEKQAALRQWTQSVWDTLYPFILQGRVLPTGPPPGDHRAPHHVSFCVRGADRKQMVQFMEEQEGILISSGSACSSAVPMPSHVLVALGVPPEFVHGSLRITFGLYHNAVEVEQVVLPRLLLALRRLLTIFCAA